MPELNDILRYIIPAFATIAAAMFTWKRRQKRINELRFNRKIEEAKVIAKLEGRVKAIEERICLQDDRLFKELAEIKVTLKSLDDRLFEHVKNE